MVQIFRQATTLSVMLQLSCAISPAATFAEDGSLTQSSTVYGSSPSPVTADLPVKYIGNAESHKFHKPSCPFARVMATNKRVEFHFRCQAVACGNVPCRYCLPQIWTVVRGSILTPLEPSTERSIQPPNDKIQHPTNSDLAAPP